MASLERDKLYKDVWSRPCTKIVVELGISSSALKRIPDVCRKYPSSTHVVTTCIEKAAFLYRSDPNPS